MSRIGKKIISLPAGVTVDIRNNYVTVKGPKGTLSQQFDPELGIGVEDGVLSVTRPTDQRHHRALHGLTRALLNNMVEGVSNGFVIRLEVRGTGYRAEMVGKNLKLSLGYAHDIEVEPPDIVSFQVEDRGATILISSVYKQLVGQIAADIRKLRPPEPYQGKGVRYAGEAVRIKAGKAGKTG
ncbi:MAG: 50S ribosomal protein L6 [Anaerolineae bacterium]|nr:50S ribosomal protein L6 [Anaerolineae bacterium]